VELLFAELSRSTRVIPVVVGGRLGIEGIHPNDRFYECSIELGR
jgi:hypothetical protein